MSRLDVAEGSKRQSPRAGSFRIKTGPRSPIGCLDTALTDLVRQAEATGPRSPAVYQKQRNILERVRRMMRAYAKELR